MWLAPLENTAEPPVKPISLHTLQLPAPCEGETEVAAHMISELLQSKLLWCKDAGGGGYQIIVQREVISSCLGSSSVAICSTKRSRNTDVMFVLEEKTVFVTNYFIYLLYQEHRAVVFVPISECAGL